MGKSKLTQNQIVSIESKLNPSISLEKRYTLANAFAASISGYVGEEDASSPMVTIFNELRRKGRKMAGRRDDRALLDEYLVANGYVRKNGSIDYPRFYKIAEIPQPSWNRYFNGTNGNAPIETLLKIVLALRMPTQDAIKFMSSAGSGFYTGNEQDMLILAFIDSDYLGLTEVVDIQNMVFDLLEILGEKRSPNDKKNKKNSNIYDF